jgi:hypothetical protein
VFEERRICDIIVKLINRLFIYNITKGTKYSSNTELFIPRANTLHVYPKMRVLLLLLLLLLLFST